MQPIGRTQRLETYGQRRGRPVHAATAAAMPVSAKYASGGAAIWTANITPAVSPMQQIAATGGTSCLSRSLARACSLRTEERAPDTRLQPPWNPPCPALCYSGTCPTVAASTGMQGTRRRVPGASLLVDAVAIALVPATERGLSLDGAESTPKHNQTQLQVYLGRRGRRIRRPPAGRAADHARPYRRASDRRRCRHSGRQ